MPALEASGPSITKRVLAVADSARDATASLHSARSPKGEHGIWGRQEARSSRSERALHGGGNSIRCCPLAVRRGAALAPVAPRRPSVGCGAPTSPLCLVRVCSRLRRCARLGEVDGGRSATFACQADVAHEPGCMSDTALNVLAPARMPAVLCGAPVKRLGLRLFSLQTAIVLLGGVAAYGRVRAIQLLPEHDADAVTHLAIAQRLLVHPFQLSLHWVWLPAYHYYLCALLGLRADAQAVRFVNAGLAGALPWLLFGYARVRATHPAVPWVAALFCTVAPIVNLLGISAQQETWFAVLILCCAWAIDAQRFALAALLLAVAAMVRYEAWGSVGVVAAAGAAQSLPALAQRLPRFARAPRALLLVATPALLAIVGWLLAHRIATGKWLGFLKELYRFTSAQRAVLSHGWLMDLLWFPVLLPLLLFGLTLPLAAVGLRRAWRLGFLVPGGICAFLLLSYASKGSLGSGRYFDALAPFVCLCAAEGVARLSANRSATLAWLSASTAACLVVLAGWLLRWTYHL